MGMTLLSITVWFTQFLIASALYFNTLSPNTLSNYTETTQITPETTTTNPEPESLIYSTASSPLTASTTQDSITNLPSEVQTQPNITSNVTLTQKTASLHQHTTSTPSQNGTTDDDMNASTAGDVIMSHATVSTNFARLTPQRDDSNETGTTSSVSYNYDRHTVQTTDTFDSVSTVPWRHSTENEDVRTKAGEGNYERNSTQATFANMTEESRGTQGTEGSYTFTSEHREEHYNTSVNTVDVSTATETVSNEWSTLQSTDIPLTTPSYTTAQDLMVTDAPENHTSIAGVINSTAQENTQRFTNSTAPTGRENRTETGTPSGTTTNINISIITDIITDKNSLNATTIKTNKTDNENNVGPTCLNSNPELRSRRPRLVCFITLWTLAMTATIFLGISIFLWVRLSVIKKKMKKGEKGGRTSEKESLWADPKASVQDRVEFWYVNGSTLEADRKEKDRKRQERMKRRGRGQDNEENSLWIQPRVTVDDITEFWYANRRMREERIHDT